MTKRGVVAIVVVAIAAFGGFLVWMRDRSDENARPAARPGAAPIAETSAKPPPARPARLIVAVTGANGPLAGATVRVSRDDGDVGVLQTGPGGLAQSDALEPGTWTISASARDHEPAALAPRELHAGETMRVELTLAAGGRTLSGLVTDVTGGPIAGARIDAARLGGMARPSEAVATALTDADGRYTLSVAAGQLLVAASEPSYAPQSRYVEIGSEGGTADFQLVPGGVIEGVVLDERTREPISGAAVDAERDTAAMLLGERGRRRAITGKDGRFRITGLRPGSFNLEAQAGALVSRGPTTIGLGVAEQVTDVEILIASAPSIRGVVLDETGAPAADVGVSMFGRGGDLAARSDAKGAFILEGAQPGRYQLIGSGAEFLPSGTTTVEVGVQDVDGVKVNVRRGVPVKGHVEPRQICEVVLDMPRADLGELMLFSPRTTGPDGAFDLGPAKPSAYQLDARCPSGARGSKQVTAGPGLGEVVIEVKPGASIAGRVTDAAGKPIAAVTVMASLLGDAERTTIVNGVVTSGVQALTGAQGLFELRGLAAGTYRLGVLDRGRPLPPKGESPRVTLAAAEHKSGVSLVVDRPDGVIRGVVTGPDGKPLPDAWVSLDVGVEDLLEGQLDREGDGSRIVRVETNDGGGAGALAPALTDASGKFELRGLARVPMTVTAEAKGGTLRGQATRVVPDATITIQARGFGELRGTVKGPSGPPAWFTVQLEGPTREQRSFASRDGAFSFARVEPGKYHVTVTSSAGNGDATVEVASGSPATVEIVLASNAIVVGKLVDGAGKPLGGIPVAIVPDAGGGKLRVQLDGPPLTSSADGTFRLEAKVGRSALFVMVPQKPIARSGLVLEAGKTLDVGTVTVETAGPPQQP